jgi:nicotinamide riboside transporter PnuC
MKGMQPTVVLYIGFTIIAIHGYVEWKKQKKGD